MEIVQTRGDVDDRRHSGWNINVKEKQFQAEFTFRDENDKERMMVIGEKPLPENWRKHSGIVRVLKQNINSKKPLLWFKELTDKVKNIDFLDKWVEPVHEEEERGEYNMTQRRFVDQNIPRSPVDLAEANKATPQPTKPGDRVAEQLSPERPLSGQLD